MDVGLIRTALGPLTPPTSGGTGGVADGFGKALGEAVRTLDQLQQQADGATEQLAAGESIDLHDVMIAQEQAGLGMQFAVQVRNKLVEAYQDVTRMQI